MSENFHLSMIQVILYAGIWVGLDGIKAICGHEIDWRPIGLLSFFAAGLLALGFFNVWKPFLP